MKLTVSRVSPPEVREAVMLDLDTRCCECRRFAYHDLGFGEWVDGLFRCEWCCGVSNEF